MVASVADRQSGGGRLLDGQQAGGASVFSPTDSLVAQCVSVPVRVALGDGHVGCVDVAFGRDHVAVIAQERSGRLHLYSWGANECGQLGHSDTRQRAEPELVAKLEHREPLHVACGLAHTACVTESGALYLCGAIVDGERADDDSDDDDDDDDVAGLGVRKPKRAADVVDVSVGGGNSTRRIVVRPVRSKLRNVIAISCGDRHVVALTKRRAVYSWGGGADGALGVGDERPRAKPSAVDAVPRHSGHRAERIACGAAHSVVITDDRHAFSWGQGRCGKLGMPDSVGNELLPKPLTALRNREVLDLACGGDFTVAIVSRPRPSVLLASRSSGEGMFTLANALDQLSKSHTELPDAAIASVDESATPARTGRRRRRHHKRSGSKSSSASSSAPALESTPLDLDDMSVSAETSGDEDNKLSLHDFRVKTFTKPSWCGVCDQFLWGLVRQGVRCSKCSLAAHHFCRNVDLSGVCPGRRQRTKTQASSSSASSPGSGAASSSNEDIGLLRKMRGVFHSSSSSSPLRRSPPPPSSLAKQRSDAPKKDGNNSKKESGAANDGNDDDDDSKLQLLASVAAAPVPMTAAPPVTLTATPARVPLAGELVFRDGEWVIMDDGAKVDDDDEQPSLPPSNSPAGSAIAGQDSRVDQLIRSRSSDHQAPLDGAIGDGADAMVSSSSLGDMPAAAAAKSSRANVKATVVTEDLAPEQRKRERVTTLMLLRAELDRLDTVMNSAQELVGDDAPTTLLAAPAATPTRLSPAAELAERDAAWRRASGRAPRQDSAAGGGGDAALSAPRSPRSSKRLMELEHQLDEMRREMYSLRQQLQNVWEIDADEVDMTMGEKLGEGACGEVWRATYRGQDVAVKILNKKVSSRLEADFDHELAILREFKCPYTVMFYGVCKKPHPCLVMEYAARGSLRRVLKLPRQREPLDWPNCINFAYQIAKGVHALHSWGNGIIHRDLKPLSMFFRVIKTFLLFSVDHD
jgi:Protein tyrosine and serine/threonine kinase/Phorbol esters/diacylglycerol binding domain (C1 domain)/Regulator of chromosome condensation (RCC1) repeat